MRSHTLLPLLLLGASLAVAACGDNGSDTHIVLRDANAQLDTLLGPGDIRIYNGDSAVDLILVGDRISAGLAPRVVNEVRGKTIADTARDHGFGGSIAKFVKTTVAGAIGTRVEYPLADVDSIHYANGGLVFTWKDGKRHNLFEHANVNGKDADKTFSEADVNRFIAAVSMRKKQLRQD